MYDVALGAGQADVSQTRSSSLRTRVKDVLARAGRGVPSRQQCDPWDVRRRLRVSREWRHEKAEDEGQEKPNGGVRHRSLLRLWT
jgi:hypothetical protein